MKRLITLAGLLVATTAFGGPETNKVVVPIVRHGTNLTERPSAAIATNVIKLLQSCSVCSTAYAVKAETWRDFEHSDSFVHVRFSAPRKLSVEVSDNQGLAERAIEEILVPLPEGKWPAHIFAKSGTNVLSFTKYDPIALKRVALEPCLHLSSVEPYASLARIEQPNK
jgi:hypothetical protein